MSALALALTANQAQAVPVSPNGSGQVLLFPYYTVQSRQSTLLTLSNSSEHAKIRQVNFRGGYTGRHVLGFDLVPGTRDSWSGTVFSRPDADAAALATSDSSGTLPAFAAGSTGPALQIRSTFAVQG
ncbi:hypothetical protein DFR29_104193 [Tahibacter aquaticus]|uniref:Uncharacterized protein n=1 Tax=Tahibacter aquaticus TaxID=520092 RepID=A0A4R6Z2D8_9GAMM|nr:hypothetical protein [Tahibacter aquaticus]TDR45765.1 hypothetical protein DFR29_104193 [Tahibacter aquaticus]